MARRKKSDDSGGLRGDEWLGTYSDCVTLLLTFFILLYAMSSVDAQKVQSISHAFVSVMTGQSGDTFLQYNQYNGTVPIIGGESNVEGADDGKPSAKESMYQDVKKYVEQNNLNQAMDIKSDKRGIILELKDSILFETAKADLIPDSKVVLEKINTLIESIPNNILIEGHTDNIPISNSKYASNWELSTARAVTVVRYFVEGKHQDATKFSAAGYGEFRPIVDNNTEENRSQNRRVSILIEYSKGEES